MFVVKRSAVLRKLNNYSRILCHPERSSRCSSTGSSEKEDVYVGLIEQLTYEQYIKKVLCFKGDEFDYEKVLKKPAPRNLLPHKPPFIKNVFKGTFDTDVLAFPQALDKRRLEELEKNVELISKFVKDEIDSSVIDETGELPSNVLQIMKDLRLFSQKLPLNFGGLDYTSTEYSRVMEVISQDMSLACVQFTHEILCLKAIFKYGDAKQKGRYLENLTTGKWFASYCLMEPECSLEDIFSITTKASSNMNDFILKGKKSFVCNAENSDLFVVLAKTNIPIEMRGNYIELKNEILFMGHNEQLVCPEDDLNNTREQVTEGITAFIVEKDFEGITYEKDNTLGVCGANFCTVTFNNTPVPAENILGNLNEGYKIALDNSADDRYIIGTMAIAAVKSLLNDVCNYALKNKLGLSRLHENGIIQAKLGSISSKLYAMESMVYLTCGLLDMYETPDCTVESSIVKVFCSQTAAQCLDEFLQIYGYNSYVRSKPYEKYLRDIRLLSLFDVGNDAIRLYIGLSGLLYLSDTYENLLKTKAGFGLYKEAVRMAWLIKGNMFDEPRLHLKLYQFLHPSLTSSSNKLETVVIRFQHAIHILSNHYGPYICKKHVPIMQLADCAIAIYAMTAVLSRASRSYCIGLRNADEELVLADTFVRDQYIAITQVLNLINDETSFYLEDQRELIAKKTLEAKGYIIQHALKYD